MSACRQNKKGSATGIPKPTKSVGVPRRDIDTGLYFCGPVSYPVKQDFLWDPKVPESRQKWGEWAQDVHDKYGRDILFCPKRQTFLNPRVCWLISSHIEPQDEDSLLGTLPDAQREQPFCRGMGRLGRDVSKRGCVIYLNAARHALLEKMDERDPDYSGIITLATTSEEMPVAVEQTAPVAVTPPPSTLPLAPVKRSLGSWADEDSDEEPELPVFDDEVTPEVTGAQVSPAIYPVSTPIITPDSSAVCCNDGDEETFDFSDFNAAAIFEDEPATAYYTSTLSSALSEEMLDVLATVCSTSAHSSAFSEEESTAVYTEEQPRETAPLSWAKKPISASDDLIIYEDNPSDLVHVTSGAIDIAAKEAKDVRKPLVQRVLSLPTSNLENISEDEEEAEVQDETPRLALPATREIQVVSRFAYRKHGSPALKGSRSSLVSITENVHAEAAFSEETIRVFVPLNLADEFTVCEILTGSSGSSLQSETSGSICSSSSSRSTSPDSDLDAVKATSCLGSWARTSIEVVDNSLFQLVDDDDSLILEDHENCKNSVELEYNEDASLNKPCVDDDDDTSTEDSKEEANLPTIIFMGDPSATFDEDLETKNLKPTNYDCVVDDFVDLEMGLISSNQFVSHALPVSAPLDLSFSWMNSGDDCAADEEPTNVPAMIVVEDASVTFDKDPRSSGSHFFSAAGKDHHFVDLELGLFNPTASSCGPPAFSFAALPDLSFSWKTVVKTVVKNAVYGIFLSWW